MTAVVVILGLMLAVLAAYFIRHWCLKGSFSESGSPEDRRSRKSSPDRGAAATSVRRGTTPSQHPAALYGQGLPAQKPEVARWAAGAAATQLAQLDAA